VAAIILSQYPTLSPTGVLQLLQESSGDGLGVRIDDKLGYGLVNAAAILPDGNTRAQVAALANEAARVEAARVAAEQAAAAESARVAAEQAAAAEAARVAASVPVVRKSLKVKSLKKKRLSVSIAAPAGSTTVIQRKVGKKWKTVTVRQQVGKKWKTVTVRQRVGKKWKTVTVRQQVGKKWKKVRVAETLPSSTIRVPRAGTYRVQITIPSGKITTKSYRVR
jgi:hypothetical protein